MGASHTKDTTYFCTPLINTSKPETISADQIDPSKIHMLTLEEKKEIVLGKKEGVESP
jgi:hypothetical protein